MKIEKLTENKIRVIVEPSELGLSNDNVHTMMHKTIGSQEFFLNILRKAEKEVDFNTDGCKLLIETFSSFDDFFVFTITKYIPNAPKNTGTNKKLIVKRKTFPNINQKAICRFDNFDAFCEFCNAAKVLQSINSSLYSWKGFYYLILKNVDVKSYSILSEFAKFISSSDIFEYKLLEHGNAVIKKNAISTGIKFFTK